MDPLENTPFVRGHVVSPHLARIFGPVENEAAEGEHQRNEKEDSRPCDEKRAPPSMRPLYSIENSQYYEGKEYEEERKYEL